MQQQRIPTKKVAPLLTIIEIIWTVKIIVIAETEGTKEVEIYKWFWLPVSSFLSVGQ